MLAVRETCKLFRGGMRTYRLLVLVTDEAGVDRR